MTLFGGNCINNNNNQKKNTFKLQQSPNKNEINGQNAEQKHTKMKILGVADYTSLFCEHLLRMHMQEKAKKMKMQSTDITFSL